MQSQVYVLSDVHLEGKSATSHKFMLDKVNGLLNKARRNGIAPTLVLAGDIHNGTKGFAWMQQIEAPIIYVCGNHEFWNGDYNEVIRNLQAMPESNVTYLHNDLVEIGDHIFIGGSMWSDLGQSLNPDLFSQTTFVMNDAFRITHKEWYQKPENIEKLHKTYGKDTVQRLIEGNLWNTLAEVEENKKTVTFFNNVALVLELLKKIPSHHSTLEYARDSTYKPLSQEDFNHSLSILNSYRTENLETWLKNCQGIEPLSFFGAEILKPTAELETIFSKLKKMDWNKELVVVSHHLPFLEERLVGRQDWSRNKDVKLTNSLREDIYGIYKGLDYPDTNYFWRISKGDYSRDDSIVEAVHYCNNGVGNLSDTLISQVGAWVHGHDHHYNYQDYLKGMPIATNPMGYSMAVFVIRDDKIHLGAPYKEYHNVIDEEKEIEEITNSFIRPVHLTKAEYKKDIVKLWVLKNFDLTDYMEIQENLIALNKRLLNYVVRRPLLSLGQGTVKEVNEIKMISNAIDFNLSTLDAKNKELINAVALRIDPGYSFMNKTYGLIDGYGIEKLLRSNRSDYLGLLNKDVSAIGNIGNAFLPKAQVDVEIETWQYESLVDKAFYNIVILKQDMKSVVQLKERLDQVNVGYIYDINNQQVAEVFPKPSYKFMKGNESKLQEKKHALIEKYRTPEIKEVLKKQEAELRKRLDF